MIKVVLAAFVKSFDVVAPAETNERSMEIKDSFVRDSSIPDFVRLSVVLTNIQVIFPAAMECKLVFVPRQL